MNFTKYLKCSQISGATPVPHYDRGYKTFGVRAPLRRTQRYLEYKLGSGTL